MDLNVDLFNLLTEAEPSETKLLETRSSHKQPNSLFMKLITWNVRGLNKIHKKEKLSLFIKMNNVIMLVL